jgi:hypothetical protein
MLPPRELAVAAYLRVVIPRGLCPRGICCSREKSRFLAQHVVPKQMVLLRSE